MRQMYDVACLCCAICFVQYVVGFCTLMVYFHEFGCWCCLLLSYVVCI